MAPADKLGASLRQYVACNVDDEVTQGRAMIVLGLSAMLIATITLAVFTILLSIDFDRKSLPERVF